MKKHKKSEDEKLILDFQNNGKTLEFTGINATILKKLFCEENSDWLTAAILKSKYKKVKRQKILQIKIYPKMV